jgi:DNA-binding transcriptional ArsR family regulator
MDLTDPTAEDASAAAALFRVLADDARLRIVLLLARGEQTVSDLAAALRLRQPNVSQHLAALRAAGVSQSRRQGKNVFYGLTAVIRVTGDGSLSVSACGITVLMTPPAHAATQSRSRRD